MATLCAVSQLGTAQSIGMDYVRHDLLQYTQYNTVHNALSNCHELMHLIEGYA